MLEKGLRNLAAIVKPDKDSVVVFNPSSWPVSGPVWVKARDGKPVETWTFELPALRVRDAATARSHPSRGPSALLTATSSKTGSTSSPSTHLPARSTSIYDKELERDLVDPAAPYGVNEYVYIKGQGATAQDVTRGADTPAVTIDVQEPSFWQRATVKGSAYNTPQWTTEITLYSYVKRIDFSQHAPQDRDHRQGSRLLRVPIRRRQSRDSTSRSPMARCRPDKDMLDGACMSWYCAQDYAAVEEPGCAIVWSAVDSPLLTLCDINRDTFKSPLPPDNGHIYAYAFNNYWFTNYKASQGDEMTFRFSITSMPAYDRVAAARFGQAVRTPLCAVSVRGVTPYLRVGSRPGGTLCSVSPPNVTVQAVKQAESGKGLIIRLREVGGAKTTASLKLPSGDFREAYACNLVEVVGKRLPISARQGHNPHPRERPGDGARQVRSCVSQEPSSPASQHQTLERSTRGSGLRRRARLERTRSLHSGCR